VEEVGTYPRHRLYVLYEAGDRILPPPSEHLENTIL
jgi:hypothetical protein